MNLRRKLITTYIIISLIPFVFIAWLTYSHARQTFIEIERGKLESIVDNKVYIINSYFESFKKEMPVIEDYYNIRLNLPIVSRLSEDRTNPEYIKSKKMLDDQLGAWVKTRSDVVDLLMTDKNGKVVYSANPAHESQELGNPFMDPQGLAFSKGKEGVFSTDIFPYQIDKVESYSFLVTAPVFDFNNSFIGVVALEVDAHELYTLIQNVDGLGESGETLIGKKNITKKSSLSEGVEEILYINPLRFDPKAAFKKSVVVGGILGQPIQEALNKNNNWGLSIDYRNKQVLAVWRYLPDRDWGLVTKMDLDEVLQPARVLAFSIFVVGFITLLFILLTSMFFTSSIVGPIKELVEAIQDVGSGNFENKISSELRNNKSEIGVLAKTFIKMSENLSVLYGSLEEKVNQRTKELEESKNQAEEKSEEAEKLNKFMVNRELKIVELKQRVKDLEERLKEKKNN